MCHRRKSPADKEAHERGTESQEIKFLFTRPKQFSVIQIQLLIYVSMISLGLDALHVKTNVLAIWPNIMESDYSFEVGNEARFDESASGECPRQGYRGACVFHSRNQTPPTAGRVSCIFHTCILNVGTCRFFFNLEEVLVNPQK